MNITQQIKQRIEDNISVQQRVLTDRDLLQQIEQLVAVCTTTFQKKQKILFCGNGGSAADAQHLAAEFSGRFYIDRPPLFAEALHVNTSYLTAVGNDYGYEHIFSRLIQAKGQKGDILWAFSTSGKSPNILKALEQAKKQEMITVGFTGNRTPNPMLDYCDYSIIIPSPNTPRIQEGHILAGHIICELVEKALFS